MSESYVPYFPHCDVTSSDSDAPGGDTEAPGGGFKEPEAEFKALTDAKSVGSQDGFDKNDPGVAVQSNGVVSDNNRNTEVARALTVLCSRNAWLCFAFVAFCTGFGVLIASLRKVDETSYGVEYNIHKKQLDDAAQSGGLFLGPPGYKFIKFPSTFITVELNNRTCVSRDGLHVIFDVTFQYRMTEKNVPLAIKKYRNFDKWADVVEVAGLSAIHHSCSNYMISEFQSKRGEIQTNMEDNVRIKLEGDPDDPLKTGVLAEIISLQLQDVSLPQEYNDAVQEKQSAEEDIALAQNERKQEITKAETVLLRSVEEARKILDTAASEANLLLTEARLKAEETTYGFEKEAETIKDLKSSLNLTTEGILAFLFNSLLSEVENLTITSGEPARLSRSDEL